MKHEHQTYCCFTSGPLRRALWRRLWRTREIYFVDGAAWPLTPQHRVRPPQSFSNTALPAGQAGRYSDVPRKKLVCGIGYLGEPILALDTLAQSAAQHPSLHSDFTCPLLDSISPSFLPSLLSAFNRCLFVALSPSRFASCRNPPRLTGKLRSLNLLPLPAPAPNPYHTQARPGFFTAHHSTRPLLSVFAELAHPSIAFDSIAILCAHCLRSTPYSSVSELPTSSPSATSPSQCIPALSLPHPTCHYA